MGTTTTRIDTSQAGMGGAGDDSLPSEQPSDFQQPAEQPQTGGGTESGY